MKKLFKILAGLGIVAAVVVLVKKLVTNHNCCGYDEQAEVDVVDDVMEEEIIK